MNFLRLFYKNGLYHYKFEESDNQLLKTAAYILSTEIRDLNVYNDFITDESFDYLGHAHDIHKVNDHIVLSGLYEGAREYIPYEKFLNLLKQWQNAYLDLPAEFLMIVDDQKNFNILYPIPPIYSDQIEAHKALHPEDFPDKDEPEQEFVDIIFENNEYQIYSLYDNSLNIIPSLLLSGIPQLNYLIDLNEPPHTCGDGRFTLKKLDDKILIQDLVFEAIILIPYENFINLMHQWHIAYAIRPIQFRIRFDNKYNFKILVMRPIII